MNGFSEEPAAPYGERLDKASFFAWLQRQEGGRYELKDGQIVMHAGSTKRHVWVTVNFLGALLNSLDRDMWAIGTADLAVEIGADVRYPDVVVERRTDEGASLSTNRPVMLVEVLSPSSSARDLNVKLAEYTSLAPLECYVVASQDEPIVWVWQRDPDTREFPKLPAELQGRDAKIEIRSLAVTIALADIYRGIGTA